jgi:hypothetical protein
VQALTEHLGVRAVRGEGGLTIVQDPKTTQFSDMPRSAIATGMADFVLPPEGMAETLLTYLRHPYVRGGEPEAVLEGKGKRGALQDILTTMLKQTQRFSILQEEHRPATHRTTHGTSPDLGRGPLLRPASLGLQ